MKGTTLLLLAATALVLVGACSSGSKVEFVQGENKIDVLVNGKAFTSYIYKDELVKPILWPVTTPAGIEVTRGFPYKEVEGESKDHPHHTGIFFTYDMNERDKFWNSREPMPQIKHVEVKKMEGGAAGTLETTMNWISVTGKTLLVEERTMVFEPMENGVAIDMTMKLTAKDTLADFEPTKEGMLAIRVAHWLKEKGQTGLYISSNGDSTAKNVWGKRAEWVALQGNKEGAEVGIAIMNHPSSENYPTYWHARDYGLFAANPLGQVIFQRSREEEVQDYQLKLEPGQSALFKFKVLVYDGHLSKEQLDEIFAAYK